MSDWFGLVERGVRVIHVTALAERWLYVTRSKILLVSEDLSGEEMAEARLTILDTLEAQK